MDECHCATSTPRTTTPHLRAGFRSLNGLAAAQKPYQASLPTSDALGANWVVAHHRWCGRRRHAL